MGGAGALRGATLGARRRMTAQGLPGDGPQGAQARIRQLALLARQPDEHYLPFHEEMVRILDDEERPGYLPRIVE